MNFINTNQITKGNKKNFRETLLLYQTQDQTSLFDLYVH